MQQRVRAPALRVDAAPLGIDRRQPGFACGEAAERLRAPLHRVAMAVAAGPIDRGVALGPVGQHPSRDGAPPVELIDGDDLCDLLKEYAIGVRTTTRMVEKVEVEDEFFAAV